MDYVLLEKCYNLKDLSEELEDLLQQQSLSVAQSKRVKVLRAEIKVWEDSLLRP